MLGFVKQSEVNYNVIVLELSKELLGSDANLFLVDIFLILHSSQFHDACYSKDTFVNVYGQN